MKKWYVYIVRCGDGSLYTGITTDVDRRIAEHNHSNSAGARYTRARRPVVLVYQEILASRAAAARREALIKRMSSRRKYAIIAGMEDKYFK